MTRGSEKKAAGLVEHKALSQVHRRQAALKSFLLAELKDQPGLELSPEEIAAHFEGMPLAYWKSVQERDLVWGLKTIHAFFAKLTGSPLAEMPVAWDWRNDLEKGFTEVVFCTWNRHGLLAKMAAAFSAARINIVHVEVYTRADDVVLDLFQLCDLNGRPIFDLSRLEAVAFLVEGALSTPPRFASVWAAQFHKAIPRFEGPAPRIRFDNRLSSAYTVMRVEGPDRLGLLYDIVQALTDSEVNIVEADIRTENQMVHDLFFLTDLEGRKLSDPARFQFLREKLLEAILS